MQLNFLETLGVLLLVLLLVLFASAVITIAYYTIKDAIDAWKAFHRKKCPFCGTHIAGYCHIYFCSRCGKPIRDNIIKDEFKKISLNCNEYREEKYNDHDQ